MIAFFQETKKNGFDCIEDAMAWVDAQAIARMGIRGHEAVAKGYADIFNV